MTPEGKYKPHGVKCKQHGMAKEGNTEMYDIKQIWTGVLSLTGEGPRQGL